MTALLPWCRCGKNALNGTDKRKIETAEGKCSREMADYTMWWVK
jgi:hypothetical protein